MAVRLDRVGEVLLFLVLEEGEENSHRNRLPSRRRRNPQALPLPISSSFVDRRLRSKI